MNCALHKQRRLALRELHKILFLSKLSKHWHVDEPYAEWPMAMIGMLPIFSVLWEAELRVSGKNVYLQIDSCTYVAREVMQYNMKPYTCCKSQALAYVDKSWGHFERSIGACLGFVTCGGRPLGQSA